MLDNIKIEDVMFLDIETVPESSSYELLNPAMQNLWDKKSKQFRSPDQNAEDVYERAGIYSEFGKIICISVGLIRGKNPFSFRLKSFFGKDEKFLLSEFSDMLPNSSGQIKKQYCVPITGKNLTFPILPEG